MDTADLVANLIAMADWIDSARLADILRAAASRLDRLEKSQAARTDAEREASPNQST
jgi:hypothetical protein